MRARPWIALPLLGLLSFAGGCSAPAAEAGGPGDYTGWPAYAGSKDGLRYSSNAQLTPQNVAQLQVAWRYSTHDKDPGNRSQNQCNPIVIDGVLYGTSPRLKLFALDAATGAQKWVFNPAAAPGATRETGAALSVNRGVAYWQSEKGDDRRLFYSVGPTTYCIDARTGRPVRSFGANGTLDLAAGLDRRPGTFNPYVAGTTPGIVYQDLLIVGARVGEGADAAPGHVRAFDVRTGRRRWIFHTIPHPGEVGYDTWPDQNAWRTLGAANCWGGMALDEKRGILYVPTGGVGGDFYGGIRQGPNLFANSLVALDAATGAYRWHFQTVHHDLWDRDLPANPNLVTLHKDGQTIDAVAQITKHGYVFVFDRLTGRPLFPVKETPVPTAALPGEEPWPTQPIPALPAPFARQRFGPNDVGGLTPETHRDLLARYRKIAHRTLFAPPSKEGGWIFPGFDGGGEWGGAAVDPQSGVLYVNSTELPWAMTMVDVPRQAAGDHSLAGLGRAVYGKYCIACHGPERRGNGSSYPSLVGLEARATEGQVRQLLAHGRNMMPAFKAMPENELAPLVAFLLNVKDKEAPGPPAVAAAARAGAPAGAPAPASILDAVPYAMTGYNRFLDASGYPGSTPPWGTLNAVSLTTGRLLWKVPLGEYPELIKKGLPPTGTEGYGGPLVTRGGLVFIAASRDGFLRAFDKTTGRELWRAPLPVPGYATPATYALAGRQYVVIACGGGKIGSPSGDEYVAFALPAGPPKAP
ncbi:MAG: PQQ-binding-like beta-propeller repeat protein [Janthinobacterium lividum]